MARDPLDTVGLSLAEILRIRRRKERLTQLYLSGQIKFSLYSEEPCTVCGREPALLSRENPDTGKAAKLPTIFLVDMDEGLICENCFQAYFCLLPPTHIARTTNGRGILGGGNGHPDVPHSEQSYDGGSVLGAW